MIALFPIPAQLSKRTIGYQGDQARKVSYKTFVWRITLWTWICRRTYACLWLFEVSSLHTRIIPGVLWTPTTVLETIRTIKLLGWEKDQAKELEGARKEELECARKVIQMQIFIGCIKQVISVVISLRCTDGACNAVSAFPS